MVCSGLWADVAPGMEALGCFLPPGAGGWAWGWLGRVSHSQREHRRTLNPKLCRTVGRDHQPAYLAFKPGGGGGNKDAHRREVSREAFVLWKFRETVPGRP